MQVYFVLIVKIEGAAWHFCGNKGSQFGLIVFLNFILMLWLMVVLTMFGDLQVFMAS